MLTWPVIHHCAGVPTDRKLPRGGDIVHPPGYPGHGEGAVHQQCEECQQEQGKLQRGQEQVDTWRSLTLLIFLDSWPASFLLWVCSVRSCWSRYQHCHAGLHHQLGLHTVCLLLHHHPHHHWYGYQYNYHVHGFTISSSQAMVTLLLSPFLAVSFVSSSEW